MYEYCGGDPENYTDPDGTRRIYIHNPGHQTQPVTINNGYEPPMTIDGDYNNTNYTVDIPNAQNIYANMELGITLRYLEWYDFKNIYDVFHPIVGDGSPGDYKKCSIYPSGAKNPTLRWERELGGNFNFGAKGAAADLPLWELLAAGAILGLKHLSIHPQSEQDAIEDGFWYFYIAHPGYQGIDGVTPPPGVVINQGPPDYDPN